MTKFRNTILLLLAFCSFCIRYDSRCYTVYRIFLPIALAVFSSLVMVRFISFSEKNRKYHKHIRISNNSNYRKAIN